MKDKVLVINPGSTSTKVAVFKGSEKIAEKSLAHSNKELAQFSTLLEQIEYRKEIITTFLKEDKINLFELQAIAARGGLLDPLEGGVYSINNQMLAKLRDPKTRQHACNLAALIAYEYSQEYNIPAYIVDPVVVDEMWEISRLAGHKEFERISAFHALNQKMVAREVASEFNEKYTDLNFVVAHMGGGISIGAHIKGRVVDVSDALDGEGPFSPERTGTLPMGQFADYILDNNLTRKEIQKVLVGNGGLVSYLGTNDLRLVEKNYLDGDKDTQLVLNAMAYQIAKYIGYFAVATKGDIQGIILTGGMSHSKVLVNLITDYVSWIAPVFVKAGEKEMEALNAGVLRVLNKEEEEKNYK